MLAYRARGPRAGGRRGGHIDEFPRPNQYGPSGRKWLDSDVKKWMEKRTPKKTVRRPKGEGEAVETRPVE